MSRIGPLALLCMGWLAVAKAFAQTDGKQILWTADWSRNATYVAYGGNIDTLKILHGNDHKPWRSIPLKSTITRITWHPTKNWIAVATQTSADPSRIINLDSGENILLSGISPDGARGLDWSHNGDYLAVGDNDGQILIYDTNGKFVRSIENENKKSITAVAWHPSKNVLVVLSDKIRIFDTAGKLLQSIKHRPEEVLMLCVAWHPSGRFFTTGDYGDAQDKSMLQFWNAQGELLQQHIVSEAEIRNLCWNRKGTRLATASEALRIWDEDGNLLHQGVSEAYLWGVSWNGKGNRLVTSSMEQQVVFWGRDARKLMILD